MYKHLYQLAVEPKEIFSVNIFLDKGFWEYNDS